MAYENYLRWRTNHVADPVLTVVVPTYNEERRLVPTLGAIASHVSDLRIPWELIIADSASSDETVALARRLGFANLNVLEEQRRDGKGAGVRRGVMAARGDYVLIADADGSTPIEAVGHFLDLARQGFDVVVGSRAHLGDEAGRTRLRRLLSAGLRALVRLALGLRVADTQCGFKLFTRSAARRLFAAQTIPGFSFDMEILYLARKLQYAVAEVPVEWVDAPGSTVDPVREVHRFLRDLGRIRINELRGAYHHA